jgi:hypothetical protein
MSHITITNMVGGKDFDCLQQFTRPGSGGG